MWGIVPEDHPPFVHVLMMFLPAGRFLTIPFPPGRPPVFAPLLARFLAAVILPPLLIFAILNSPPNDCFLC